jgi:hypothetical protein
LAGDQEIVRVQLVEKAMLVREAAPEQWEVFVRTMALYAAAMAKDMVKAEPERLHWAQGRAQAVELVADTLFNAPKLFEKSRQLEDERRRRPPDVKRTAPWTG